MTKDFQWTGSYVSGSTVCAVVRYHGPTSNRGSRWIATIKRDSSTVWRAAVPFEDGPIKAAFWACCRNGVDWTPASCHSIDPDTYAVGF